MYKIMKQIPAILLSLCLLLLSCQSNDETLSDLRDDGQLRQDTEAQPISIGEERYITVENARYGDSPMSDDFTILDFERVGSLLLIEVQYGGGCAEHAFELLGSGDWYANPDIINFLLIHNANGDLCEALITETLVFDLSTWAAANNPDFHRYRVINASTLGNQLNDRPSITVTESENCVEEVTAQKAICGIGLYNDLWLKLDNGDFVQPVGVADAYADFAVEEGKRYRVGVTLLSELPPPYNMYAICAAWPGPNEPGIINCIEEIKD